MRTILHSDLNNFYASVELLKHPECKDLPVAVTGSVEDRHGIVLAKNQLAKSFGVKTGEVIWQAKTKCHNLITLPADFESYSKISKAVRAIYGRFTDHIEPFGIDECWLDVTDSIKLFGSGEQIAEQIKDFDAFYVAYENKDGNTLAKDLLANKENLKNVAIMIGAEGGFSEDEIKLLEESGAKIVSLGNRILRTETASIVCAGVIMQMLETI
jgi:tRNA pseudouridine-54 N-methylase